MTTQLEPQEGLVVDGYRLIRPLGQGGFGVVWLAFSEASQSYHALKWVAGSQGTLETELSALRHFREVSQRLRSPNLIPVEHINLRPGALYYTLPLADGNPGNDPTNADWKPITLADYINQRKEEGNGMGTEQIISLFEPIARAAALLNKEGLVHRDIKPANILFFNGLPCLSDIGLLGRDGDSISMRGTPGYMPPSWFVESSGETDMWGLATTLYTMLTGQNPDKMGKARFRVPIGGSDFLSNAEQKEWKRLYKVIDKATDENPLERHLSLDAFADALTLPDSNFKGRAEANTPSSSDSKTKKSSKSAWIGLMMGLFGLIAWLIPLIGFFVVIVGAISAIKGLSTKAWFVSALALSLLTVCLILSIDNSVVGALNGLHGDYNDLISKIFHLKK
jgi:serine/threonine protein kinase